MLSTRLAGASRPANRPATNVYLTTSVSIVLVMASMVIVLAMRLLGSYFVLTCLTVMV